MSSWYFDGKAMLTDEEFENLREVRRQHFRESMNQHACTCLGQQGLDHCTDHHSRQQRHRAACMGVGRGEIPRRGV